MQAVGAHLPLADDRTGPGALAVRADDHLPFLLRPGLDRAGLHDRDLPDAPVPDRQGDLRLPGHVLREAVPDLVRRRRRDGDHAGVPVRHELVAVLALRRRHLRRAARDGGPARRSSSSRPSSGCGSSAGAGSRRGCTWRRSGSSSFGSALSAYFIIAANSWMQHPVGYEHARTASRQLTNIGSVLFTSTTMSRCSHVLFAAMMTARLIVLAVCAWQLRSGRRRRDVRPPGLKLGADDACASRSLGTFFIGDALDARAVENQPMKVAAAEALFENEGPAAFSVFATGDCSSQSGRRRTARSRSRTCCRCSRRTRGTGRSRASTRSDAQYRQEVRARPVLADRRRRVLVVPRHGLHVERAAACSRPSGCGCGARASWRPPGASSSSGSGRG